MSDLLALIAQRKASVSRIKTIKPAAGRNRYRIIPSWRTDATHGPKDQFWMDFAQHFLKDGAGQIKAVYVCAEKTFGRPCPICNELHRGIANAHDEDQKKRLKDAQSNGRVLLNVYHLDGPTPNEPQVLELAPSAFNGKKGVGGILSLFTDWPKLVSLGGAADGCADVIIEKQGAGLDTAYGVSAVPSSISITAMPKVQDLDKFVMQENDQGAQRALATVSAITGLLPAPSTPSLSSLAAEVLDDVPDLKAAATAPAPVAAPATAPVQATAPVAPNPFEAGGETDDLEALLATIK